MLYWGLDDDLVLCIVALSVLSIYVSYHITRVSKGAPRAWYVIMAAFVIASIYRGVQLYFDAQAPTDIIDDWEALISLLGQLLLLIGLIMLDRSFRKVLKVAQGG